MTGLTAALDANMNDLHMPAAAYTRSTWIVADDDDIPPLVAETIPFVSEASPADSEASPADSEASPAESSPDESSPTESSDSTDTKDAIDAMETSDTTDAEPDYTWSDVPSESDGTSDSDEEDSRIPPQPWEGIPTALVVLFFAYMFTLSIGIWTGRLLV
jgi:hypothetical protein